MASTTKPEAEKVVSEATIKNRLTEQAMREVRDNHRDEYTEIVTRLFKAEGLEYKPRLSPKERAAAQIKKIAEENGIDLEDLLPEDEPEPITV